MSRIYAAGVRATALTNITTDIAAYISYDANGVLVVDVEALVGYLQAQFLLISTGAEYVAPATAASSLAAAQAVNVRALAEGLVNDIGATAWSGRADWPTGTEVLTGATLVGALKSAMAATQRAASELSAYFAGLNTNLRTLLTNKYYEFGLDSSVPAGVVRLIRTTTYIQTFVTDKLEESGPSTASPIIRVDQNDTVTITPVAAPSGRNISYFRLYRSNSANQGAAYQYLPNPANENGWPVATSSVVDDVIPEALEEPCPTLTWDEPPALLTGLVGGANGMLAGGFSNQWCPCVPFEPYAFRLNDRKSLEHPFVAQGFFINTFVVLTKGWVYYITGSDSSSMDATKTPYFQPCLSRRSVVSMAAGPGWAGGVVWAGPDGLCFADSNGVKVITGPQEEGGFGLFTREEWQALVPSSIFAAEREGAYVFHYTKADATTGVYMLNVRSGKLVALTNTGSAFYRDGLTDLLYMAQSTAIKALMAHATNKRTAVWKSPIIVMHNWPTWGWLQVESEFATSVTVKWYAQGVLKRTAVLTSRTPVRMPPVRAVDNEIQIESSSRVTSVLVTDDTGELQAS